MYDKFEELISKKKLTAYRVAKDIGISPVVFSEWKRGKSTPKLDKLVKIANYLEVPLEELITEIKTE